MSYYICIHVYWDRWQHLQFLRCFLLWASCWWLDTIQRGNEGTEELTGKSTVWELDKEKMMTWKTGQGGNREGPTIRAHLGKHTHSVILYISEISHVSTVQSRLTGSWPEKFQVWTFYRCFQSDLRLRINRIRLLSWFSVDLRPRRNNVGKELKPWELKAGLSAIMSGPWKHLAQYHSILLRIFFCLFVFGTRDPTCCKRKEIVFNR